MHRPPIQLIACDAGHRFAEGVARHLGQPLVRTQEVWFSCGEGKLVIEENIRGNDVYVFQQPIGPGADGRSVYDRLVMLLHAVEAAALSDADSVTAVMPYYPGARQDKRKSRVREGISAGLVARMLESAGATRVISVEIHNEAIGGMFTPRLCTLENLYLTQGFSHWLREKGLCGDTVVSPDVGGLERARRYAAALGSALAAISKERNYALPNKVVSATLIGEVEGHDVLLVDDIIDTAGSVTAAVEELKSHGAAGITVACAHPVISGPGWARLGALAERARAEGWRLDVVGTSSVHHEGAPSWYHEFPIEDLVARVIRSINERGSVTTAQEEG